MLYNGSYNGWRMNTLPFSDDFGPESNVLDMISALLVVLVDHLLLDRGIFFRKVCVVLGLSLPVDDDSVSLPWLEIRSEQLVHSLQRDFLGFGDEELQTRHFHQ